MEMPNGERLILTIGRVVDDVECKYCKGTGDPNMFEPIPDHFGAGIPCQKCKGTGRRKVRVRGHVEVGITCYCSPNCKPVKFVGISTIGRQYNIGGCKDVLAACEAMRDRIIAAHLDGTLPDGVAHITEEDAD